MASLKYSLLLPDKSSPDLCLTHPTLSECLQIWAHTSSSWRDALSISQYLEESEYLLTVPLARDAGMTRWILVDKNDMSDQRAILSSCETFRKKTIFSGGENSIAEGFMHGVASVFTFPSLRGHGYAGRMMRELAVKLRTWQIGQMSCLGSILYSDIGKEYYSRLGWHPALSNFEVEFPAACSTSPSSVRLLVTEDLEELCATDEILLRKRMLENRHPCFAVVPDLEHMLWHHAKEEFACKKLFSKIPIIKGAVVGEPGARVWLIWTHRYYHLVENSQSGNTLYILRLVIEDELAILSDKVKETVRSQLEALFQCAQREAFDWRLNSVKLWNPSGLVMDLMGKTKILHEMKERHSESIASLIWYGDRKAGVQQSPLWIANEKYAWC